MRTALPFDLDAPRLKEDEGGVPSMVAEAHRKELQDMDNVVRKEQQVQFMSGR